MNKGMSKIIKHFGLDIDLNYLSHHGIKNQRWGVRNGPPYPLNEKVSKRIKKKGQEKIRVSNSEYRKRRSDLNKNFDKTKVAQVSHLGSAHDRQWREVIMASDLPEPMNFATVAQKNENFRKLNAENSRDLSGRRVALEIVNHDYGAPGTTNNCTKCTASLAMRIKGYDIQAGRSSNGALNSCMQYWFDGAVPYKEKGSNAMDRMLKGGRNSYGEIQMRYPNGGGHSMFYHVDKNGNLHIRDGQCNRSFQLKYSDRRDPDRASRNAKVHWADFVKTYGFDESQFAQITRLDNCSPNFKHMEEDSVCRVQYVNNAMNKVQNTKTGRIVDTW